MARSCLPTDDGAKPFFSCIESQSCSSKDDGAKPLDLQRVCDLAVLDSPPEASDRMLASNFCDFFEF